MQIRLDLAATQRVYTLQYSHAVKCYLQKSAIEVEYYFVNLGLHLDNEEARVWIMKRPRRQNQTLLQYIVEILHCK